MLDVVQFRDIVIVPALRAIGMHSPAAVELLLGTALQESRLKYLKQLGRGPAVGLFQMEPNTHDDIWDNYLGVRHRFSLAMDVASLAHKREAASMATDLLYAAAMCRVHYLRIPEPLPRAGDVDGQAAYWKDHYNTYLGAGTEEEYIAAWENYGVPAA